jgi:hypothetical protein
MIVGSFFKYKNSFILFFTVFRNFFKQKVNTTSFDLNIDFANGY